MSTSAFLLTVLAIVILVAILLAIGRCADALERIANCTEAHAIMNAYHNMEDIGERD